MPSQDASEGAAPVTPVTTEQKKRSLTSYISSSAVATVLMVAYMSMAMYNLYGLMYPLSRVDDPRLLQANNLIHPLYEPQAKLAMKVYLSTKPRFQQDFFQSELKPRWTIPKNHLSKTLVLL